MVPPARAELLAYHDGTSREIAALRQRPALSGGSLDSIGALAVGLPVEEYRRLTASVDDYLRRRSGRVEDSVHVTTKLDSTMGLLDSLRLEWLVLKVRRGQ